MEAAEVHEGVGGQEEVGRDDGDPVQGGDHSKAHGDKEHQQVASIGIVVGSVASGEEKHAGIQPIFTHRLKCAKKLTLTILIALFKKLCGAGFTCKTLGAPTREAMAEDKLALKPPAYRKYPVKEA